MQQLQPLEQIENLEITLKPLFKKDTKKYYSNLDLTCMSMDLLYKAHLILEQIEKNENYNQKLIESNNLTKKAYLILNLLNKNPIYWNDEDIEKSFNLSMLKNVNKC